MKTFKQLCEQVTSYDQHMKRVQKIDKGTYKGLEQMGGRSHAHVEHSGGATYVPVHQIQETVNENFEDDHSDASNDFAHLISHVIPSDRKKYVDGFHKHMTDFHTAHENHDDEQMRHSLDGIDKVNSDLYKASKVKYLMDTDLARLIDHRPGLGYDIYHGIVDAAHKNDHDAVNKHINDLQQHISYYNIK